MGGWGLDLHDLGQGPMAGPFEHHNEPFGSIKDGEFLDQLNDYQVLKVHSASWT
jgi:hypothetical protein